jgi:hypothetical protein
MRELADFSAGLKAWVGITSEGPDREQDKSTCLDPEET